MLWTTDVTETITGTSSGCFPGRRARDCDYIVIVPLWILFITSVARGVDREHHLGLQIRRTLRFLGHSRAYLAVTQTTSFPTRACETWPRRMTNFVNPMTN